MEPAVVTVIGVVAGKLTKEFSLFCQFYEANFTKVVSPIKGALVPLSQNGFYSEVLINCPIMNSKLFQKTANSPNMTVSIGVNMTTDSFKVSFLDGHFFQYVSH